MATRDKDKGEPLQSNDSTRVFTWSGLKNGDDGKPVEIPNYAERSVQASGEFGAGCVRIEGSNDGKNYSVLTDAQGMDLDLTTPQIKAVSEAVRFVRPCVVSGTDSTDLTLTLFARRNG